MVEQIGKFDLENWVKIIILEKWLIVTLNWKHYEYPPIAPPSLGANLTSFKHHEPLSNTHHKSLDQTNED
jgi:hypothetical protein